MHDSLNFRSSIFTLYFAIKLTHAEILPTAKLKTEDLFGNICTRRLKQQGGTAEGHRSPEWGGWQGTTWKKRRCCNCARHFIPETSRTTAIRFRTSRMKKSLVQWITIRRLSCRRWMWHLPLCCFGELSFVPGLVVRILSYLNII